MADPTRVHQILMNLCTNAEHAMRASGGVLEIGLREALIAPEDARRLAGLEAGRYLVLSVSDSGCGIPPDTRERIFEPFFTTKPKGEGTGLGLSVVHGIVESCRGCIEVDSELGRGSRFSVYLPVVAEEDEAVPELPVTSSVRGNGHILLVDDEPALLRAMSLFLEVQGYRVSALTQSSLALERFQAEPDSFDLIITDLTMPKMDGKRLTDRARAIRPDIPVILCSGYAHTLGEGAIAAMGINAFIRKPILRSQMIGTVLQVLQTAAGANASKTP
jgi:CheY-like chemotaxis protein